MEHRSQRDEEGRELHRTCTVERRNTADLYTKMFGGIENAVARKET